MMELSTLGRLHADGSGPAADTLVRQPKLLALVCFVALESRRGAVPVSRVCAMLWSDAELPRAPHAEQRAQYCMPYEHFPIDSSSLALAPATAVQP